MTDILVHPSELRKISEQLKSSAKKIGTALQAIDNDILSLKGDNFLGNRANAVQAHYAPKREALLKARAIVADFAEDLLNVAARFEQADKSSSTSPSTPSTPPVPDVKPVIPTTPPSVDSKLIEKIKDAIGSLNVTQNPKYLPGDGKTWCNQFVMDFCQKMGVPMPKFFDFNKDGRIDDYLDANEAVGWLKGTYNKGGVATGPQEGWKTIGADEASKYASEGKVVVVGWQNPSGSGHMAVVRPESTAGNIQIAQAGAKNFEKGAVTQGFGSRTVSYFVYKP